MKAKSVVRDALFAIAPGAMLARAHRRFAQAAQQEEAIVRALSRRSRIAIDVGANLGFFARILSETSDRVVAVEPVPYLAALLRRHMGPKVEVVEAAASDGGRERASLFIPVAGGEPIFTEASLEPRFPLGLALEAPACSLDSLDLHPVDFIKIDVEGHEEAVLRGAADMLAASCPSVWVECEERHNAGGPDRLFALMARFGYSGWFAEGGCLFPVAQFQSEKQSEDRRLLPGMDYVNNFAFLHPAKANLDTLAALAMAVKAAPPPKG